MTTSNIKVGDTVIYKPVLFTVLPQFKKYSGRKARVTRKDTFKGKTIVELRFLDNVYPGFSTTNIENVIPANSQLLFSFMQD